MEKTVFDRQSLFSSISPTQTNVGKNTHLSVGEVTLSDPCHSALEGGEI